ncbi:hypothetical protein TVNIR_0509 [Thioalkalivibrio nitratireducens DSM 14787]|uniref:Uncharacterized protein n=1 Tax=Thioalkalivibrio nitratireducens (strain DSM 14787 / UNIQEM 213 / ALEN2) TaxID=1255043 RepID=L0DV19_THIND|nr:hypothetical protein TVNIR_0509 [Thioalkalivibrio nitratireducens DSM 14787]
MLFGSTARQRYGRDIDLAVKPVSVPDLFAQGRWLRELEAVFDPVPVGLLVLTADTAPLVRFEALRDGVCLYQDHDQRFWQEQDRAFFLYADADWLRGDERTVRGNG